jgi:hypothetical protein
VGLALAVSASAANANWSEFPKFTLRAAAEDCATDATSGAKLCVRSGAVEGPCYVMPSDELKSSTLTYQFAMEPHAERVSLAAGGSWVLFSATYSGCGSGTLTRLSFLQYQDVGGAGKLIELLPYVAVTNSDEWTRWSEPGISAYPILVVAHAIWAKGETHFGSHHYTVEAWTFDPSADRYGRVLSYVTSRRYDGGDQGRVRVVGPERPEILRRLRAR